MEDTNFRPMHNKKNGPILLGPYITGRRLLYSYYNISFGTPGHHHKQQGSGVHLSVDQGYLLVPVSQHRGDESRERQEQGSNGCGEGLDHVK